MNKVLIQIGRDTFEILKIDLSTHRSTIEELSSLAISCYYWNTDKHHPIEEKKLMNSDPIKKSIWITPQAYKMLQNDAMKTELPISKLADFAIQEHYKVVNRKGD